MCNTNEQAYAIVAEKRIERMRVMYSMLKEMLDATDKRFSEEQIIWLERFYIMKHLSSNQEKIICDIYKEKMS